MRNWLLLNFLFSVFFVSLNFSAVKPIPALNKRTRLLDGFLIRRTVSISQKACSCPTSFSCACCQRVTILLRGVAKNLCANFTYQETGLSMNITLGSQAIRQVSIIDYRAFKVCTFIPDCRYSLACVDAMEVSQFPRSITICIQFDIMSKHQNWLINYNCISVSTISSNSTATTTVTPSTTNVVLNGSTGMMEMSTSGTPGAGQMPQNPGGMTMPMPGGTGQTGQNMSSGGMPPGTTGQMPSPGQMPQNQSGMPMPMPGGTGQTGQNMPAGGMPPGTPGQMPPPGQMQRMVNDGDRIIVSRSIRTVPQGYLLSRWKSRGSDKIYGKMKLQRFNELSNDDALRKEPEKKKTEFRDNYHGRKVTPNDIPVFGLNRSRVKRSNTAHESIDPPVQTAVILNRKRNRLPTIVGNESTKSLKNSVVYTAAASRSPRIVNRDTISIPMSGSGAGNVLGWDVASSNNGFQSVGNGGSTEFPGPPLPPQPNPVLPSYGLSVPLPVFVLEDAPPMIEPVPIQPIAPNFFINYDNRTSSFPDRIPPGFGVASRIGPNNDNDVKSVTSFDRSVEELETVGPEIKLQPNSKIIETSTTDMGNGNIVFPE